MVALPECKGWAELVSVPDKFVFLLPADISYQEATALTMNYILAYVLLFDMAGLAPGKSVLLHSAGGGVVSPRPVPEILIEFLDRNPNLTKLIFFFFF